MDERTEELRDIFVDVTDEETVTDSQDDARGSLNGSGASTDRIRDVVARMRERYEFDTSLSEEALADVVERVYRGESDGAVAEALDVAPSEVFRARMDLHLLREGDADAPFDLNDLRAALADDVPPADVAEDLDLPASTVRRYARVVEARQEASRVSDRFRSAFEDAVADADIGDRLTSEVTEDGLDEATDGMETDVKF